MSDEPDGTAAHSAAGGSSSDAPTKPPSDQPSRSKWLPLRHKVLTVSALVLALVAGCGSGYWMWADKQLDAIPRVEIGIDTPEQKNHHEEKYPLNILLLGADHGQVGQSVAEDLEDGKWTPGQHLSDTIMVLHIPADRKSVQLVSIPRDTWVSIDGYPADGGHGKINAAFSYGGPELAYQTVENLTGLKIDHVAIIDWVGFRDLTTALGGVRVYVPETFYDSSQRITWEKGWQTLEGDRALQYVRTRHDIPGSKQDDFGRIARQQNFMRAVMGKLLSSDTTHNPVRFTQGAGLVVVVPHGRQHVGQRRDPVAGVVPAQPAHRGRRLLHRPVRRVRHDQRAVGGQPRHAAVPGPGADDQERSGGALRQALPGQPAGRGDRGQLTASRLSGSGRSGGCRSPRLTRHFPPGRRPVRARA